MFDIASWKLLLLAAIALIVVGPKDLPVMLRTIGKYIGIIKRQASEFRAQFDEAIRDSELAEVKKEFESLGQETERTLREAEASMNAEMNEIRSEMDQVAADINRPIQRLEGSADTPELTAEAAVALNEPAAAADHVNGSAASPAEGPAAAAASDQPATAPAVAWPATQPATKAPERVEA